MFVNVLLGNSPSFSVRSLSGDPNIDIQFLKMYLTMVSCYLLRITADAESLRQWPAMCSDVSRGLLVIPLPVQEIILERL